MTATQTAETPHDSNLLEVAIIGSGPAGIIAAKTLLGENIPPAKLVVLEETSCAGGLWNREPRPEIPCFIDHDETPISVPSSSEPIYQDLRANFPKDMTSFVGYPFPTDVATFPEPKAVADYYQDFSAKTGVDKVTRFHTRVEKCTKKGEVWEIQTLNTQTKEVQRITSKRLLVCNGHFRKAFCPALPGIENFKGTVLHSSAFDSPLDHNDQTILVVGGGISGSDIAKLLLTKGTCKRVIVSARSWKPVQSIFLPSLQKKGLIVQPGIRFIDPEGKVCFEEAPPETKHKYTDNLPPTEQPDVILMATGYRYYFPFLPQDTQPFVRANGFKTERLYKRIVSIDDPTLAFLGVTNQNVSPAINMEYQAQWYAQMVVLKNRLPSFAVMLQEVQSRAQDLSQDGLAIKNPSYCNSLAADIRARGYWTQILTYRAPLMLRTWWRTRQPSKVPWMVGLALGVGVAAPYVASIKLK